MFIRQSVAGFVVFYKNTAFKPNQLQEYHIWVCANLPKKQPPQGSNPYMKQNLFYINSKKGCLYLQAMIIQLYEI